MHNLVHSRSFHIKWSLLCMQMVAVGCTVAVHGLLQVEKEMVAKADVTVQQLLDTVEGKALHIVISAHLHLTVVEDLNLLVCDQQLTGTLGVQQRKVSTAVIVTVTVILLFHKHRSE